MTSLPTSAAASLALMMTFTCALQAQQASFTTFGQGCPIVRQTPQIGNRGLPQIGQTFTITYSGPNFTFNNAQQICQPILNLGLTQIALPIPPILTMQPAGCILYTFPLVSVPMMPDPVLPQWTDFVDLKVPNDPRLIGRSMIAQWLAVFDQCGFAGCAPIDAVATSDGATIVLGT